MNQVVKYYKIADPVVQSLIFVVLTYSFNYTFFFKYYLPGIIVWQLASWVIHLFIRGRYKLKKERLTYIIAVSILMGIFFFIKFNIHESKLREFTSPDLNSMPLYELIFVSLQSFFSFWYFTISVREIRHVLRRKVS